MSYTNGLDKPTDYFNTVLYTGNGGTQSITVGFKPDLVWGKSRSGSGYHHNLVDSVRGNTKYLESDRTNAENTLTDAVTSFTSDGFTLGADAGDREFNENNNSMVAWNWLASNTTASNTDGSITSTVSANTTAGFSIVSYTGNGTNGATVGHGLGVTPDMMIIKNRSSSSGWTVYHTSTGNSGCTFLNSTDAFGDYGGGGYLRNPSSSTFETYFTGSGGSVNVSSENFIAYCFSEVKSFSKFGSYVGNGSSDGSYIHLGFKPAWVMVKNTVNNARNWTIIDNKRNPFNPEDEWLYANASDSTFDASSFPTDFVSNGFKIRNTGSYFNTSGENYIYMAFAENPFVTSTGIPTTAR